MTADANTAARRLFAEEIIAALAHDENDHLLDPENLASARTIDQTIEWVVDRIRGLIDDETPTAAQIAAAQAYADSYKYVDTVLAGRRLGIRWTPWCGDWFNSWSPRNDNSNGEGTWSEWVELALQILQHPLTAAAQPYVYAAAAARMPKRLILPGDVQLTDAQIIPHLIPDTTGQEDPADAQ